MKKIYIVGAHSRGQTLAHYLQYLDPKIQIEAFLYDNDEVNLPKINNSPVTKFNENTVLNKEYPVYLGTRGVFHQKLKKKLKFMGMKYIIPVDVNFDLDLRNKYFQKFFAEQERPFLKMNEMKIPSQLENHNERKIEAQIYVANSANDKPLKEAYELAKYECILQVGAALSDIRIGKDVLLDNTGENISDRNFQFCELTGLYWIWKNAKEDIVGLVHYRRHFIMPEDWLVIMCAHNIDVILPVPLYVSPSIAGNYKSRHSSEDWNFMLNYLKTNLPEDYKLASKFFEKTDVYSPCNMFIARKEILAELCEWLFPILFACANNGGIKADKYQNRYPGFISERLITYFFEKNSKKYKVVYADKNFLE